MTVSQGLEKNPPENKFTEQKSLKNIRKANNGKQIIHKIIFGKKFGKFNISTKNKFFNPKICEENNDLTCS